MSPLLHTFTNLRRRFRWENLAFAGIVVTCCVAPFTGIAPRKLVALAGLESLLVFWLTLRVLLADDGFKTSGGWQARPLTRGHLFGAQLLLLACLLLPPLLLHGLVIRQLFAPSPDQWQAFLRAGLLKNFLTWITFVAGLKLFSTLLLRPLEGVARKAAWSVLVIALIPVFLTALPAGLQGQPGGSGGSGEAPGPLAESIQRLLPDATEFLGEWNDPQPAEVPEARLLLTVPLDTSRRPAAPGLQVERASARYQATRVEVTLSLQSLDSRVTGPIRRDPVAILRFSNGMYSTCLRHRARESPSGMPFLATLGLSFQGTFVSPLALPENHAARADDFTPVELLFFVPDDSRPPRVTSLDRRRSDRAAPAPPPGIPPPSSGADFDLAVRQLIDSVSARDGHPLAALKLAKQLPPEAIDPILAYHPWDENAWKIVIHPFLVRHATASDKPALLERLALDPRITPFFIESGWAADADPVLRQRAKERLPLDLASLKLLVEQNDPDLAPDLAALAHRLDRGVGDLAPALRASAGFDWPGFVREGWKQRKYGDYEREGWLYAVWAAELGDPSALRRLAEEAAAGKKWEREQLARLIPAAPADLIPYLRGNLAQLAHDPATRTWR
jgi:hypothetical protein